VTNVDYAREIAASARYIEKELLPPGKKVELMQWSGDCRPPEEALRVTRLAGLAAINGGETTISRRNPTLTKVAGRGIWWGSEYQVYTACQNENVYRDQKEDGTLLFPGGFINVIDTFRRLETPRRLKPVNIYFHFYSADYRTSTEALRRIFDWAMAQPLQAITARHYTDIVKDAVDTRIFEAGTNEFVLVNKGDLRTFRLPKEGLFPDMTRSSHVTGWIQDTNAIYLHTDGNPRVRVAFSQNPPPRLRLISSTMPINFSTFQPNVISFVVKDYRPGRVRFGGLVPGAKLAVQINDEKQDKVAGKEGDILLELNNEATVTLTIVDGG
jgi:polysaccharide biosynthesis protein PelA